MHAKSCPALCNLLDCSLPGSSVRGISKTRILEWITFSSPGNIPDPEIELASPVTPALEIHWTTWKALCVMYQFSSVQFSHSFVPDSLRSHGVQHAMLPCPSPTPGDCSNLCPSGQWCHPTISSSAVPFSHCVPLWYWWEMFNRLL